MRSYALSDHGTPDSRLQLALSRELRSGERVVWQGGQLARIALKGFGLYVFAIPWTAFALFWTAMAASGVGSMESDSGAGALAWAFPLFGLPFILVGLAMMSVPFLPLWERGKVLYAITDQRVLKLRLGRTLDVKACPAARIGHIDRRERRDGTGSISLAVSVGTDSDGDANVERFEIGEIADVFSAHEAIATLRASSSASSPIAAPDTPQPRSQG